MAMTRKDYRAIADILKMVDDSTTRYPGNLFMQAAARRVVRRTILELTHEFGRTNRRFDRAKFEDACGFVGCSDDDRQHISDPINLEEHARDTSKQKRRSAVA